MSYRNDFGLGSDALVDGCSATCSAKSAHISLNAGIHPWKIGRVNLITACRNQNENGVICGFRYSTWEKLFSFHIWWNFDKTFFLPPSSWRYECVYRHSRFPSFLWSDSRSDFRGKKFPFLPFCFPSTWYSWPELILEALMSLLFDITNYC